MGLVRILQLTQEATMPVAPAVTPEEDERVSIGKVKRDISELVNRVAFGGERIVLTSRGNPKAALVSLEDYERLLEGERHRRREQWELWKASANRLAGEIRERRAGEGLPPLDSRELLDASRRDLEARTADAGRPETEADETRSRGSD